MRKGYNMIEVMVCLSILICLGIPFVNFCRDPKLRDQLQNPQAYADDPAPTPQLLRIVLPAGFKMTESRYLPAVYTPHLGASQSTVLLEVHATDDENRQWLLLYYENQLIVKTQIVSSTK